MHAHAKPPKREHLLWRMLRARDRPGGARTVVGSVGLASCSRSAAAIAARASAAVSASWAANGTCGGVLGSGSNLLTSVVGEESCGGSVGDDRPAGGAPPASPRARTAAAPRVRSHYHFAPPFTHAIPDSLRDSVPLWLKRQCD
jgi:hypothetical protein